MSLEAGKRNLLAVKSTIRIDCVLVQSMALLTDQRSNVAVREYCSAEATHILNARHLIDQHC